MDHLENPSTAKNKAEFVYQTLRTQILNGVYAPGTALYIRELSIQLNVSRTPVKEAISRLSYEEWNAENAAIYRVTYTPNCHLVTSVVEYLRDGIN